MSASYGSRVFTQRASAVVSGTAEGGGRAAGTLRLAGLGLLWLAAAASLLSYRRGDAAYSTSGDGQPLANWLGAVGAWWADGVYYLAGFSAWWLMLFAAVRWFAAWRARGVQPEASDEGLGGWRSGSVAAPDAGGSAAPDGWRGRLRAAQARAAARLRAGVAAMARALGVLARTARRPAGVLAVLAACWVLEATRLYGLSAKLPYRAGGVLGQSLGDWAQAQLGFTGAAMAALVLLTVGLAWSFGFRWLDLAERIGAGLEWLFGRQARLRELRDDLELGRQAALEREQARQQQQPAHASPLPAASSPPGAPEAAPLPTPQPAAEIDIDFDLDGDGAAPQTPAMSSPAAGAAAGGAAAAAAVARTPGAASAGGGLLIEPPAQPEMSARLAREKQRPLFEDLPDSPLPQIDLLDAAPARQETVAAETLEFNSRLIEKKLADFGVQVKVVAAYPGPVVTRYEIEPATGVKGATIVGLAKDLARSLSLISIRVVETIPGKNYMALELPNARRQMIRHGEILGSKAYADSASLLALGLGKDIVGQPVVADLAKMPHLLVAGTTGSGKSVGINAMILSVLYKATPEQVRLILIDPKMLEMSVYEGIPHLLAPVVTDMKQAAHALNWCVAEMERRYKLMSKLGVRQLSSFNARVAEARARGETLVNPLSLTPEAPEPLAPLPYIVVVIDELADLMMVVGKKIEELIARLAQKARAAGIHLILATQRPSVDVITGLIKANVPSRIAFQVSSKIDSRTILDQMGAESLLGQGDMLFMPVGQQPQRVHGAFVSDAEVHRVAEFLKSKGAPDYVDGILTGESEAAEQSSWQMEGLVEPGRGADAERDPLYDQAVDVVLRNGKATISSVQRHLRIGYNRSARILEQMEKAGLIGKLQPNGDRPILVPVRSVD